MAFATSAALPISSRAPQLCARRSPVATAATQRATATTPSTNTGTEKSAEISSHARDLRGYLRAHKSIFDPGMGFLAQTITLTRKNDTGRMLIPAVELATNAHLLPGRTAAEYILEHNDELVDSAAASVLAVMPGVSDEVAEIVRHDLAYVLRVTSYAVAVQSADFIHENNLGIMRELHTETSIPTAATCSAIVGMGEKICANVSDDTVAQKTRDCFEVIAEALAAETVE